MATELAGLSWNPVGDLEQLTEFPFMVQALEAGTIVAVMAGAIGWFMVLRRQTFAGHTLSVIAFPGRGRRRRWPACRSRSATSAPAASGRWRCRWSSRPGQAGLGGESAAIGTVQAFGLGLGFLFVSLYGGQLAGLRVAALRHLPRDHRGAGADAAVGRRSPRWRCSPRSAGRCCSPRSTAPSPAPAGCRRGALALAFLLLLGLAVAATAEITGALLVFALLVTPAATAQQITARPGPGLALSVTLALAVTWVGLAIAYFSPYPVGFWVTSLSFGLYVAVRLARPRGSRSPAAPGGGLA